MKMKAGEMLILFLFLSPISFQFPSSLERQLPAVARDTGKKKEIQKRAAGERVRQCSFHSQKRAISKGISTVFVVSVIAKSSNIASKNSTAGRTLSKALNFLATFI